MSGQKLRYSLFGLPLNPLKGDFFYFSLRNSLFLIRNSLFKSSRICFQTYLSTWLLDIGYSILKRSRICVLTNFTFNLAIGYWQFLIEKKQNLFPDNHFLIRYSLFEIPYSKFLIQKKQNLFPDRPYALCTLLYALCSMPSAFR